MELHERYAGEAPAPTAATLHETITYIFEESQRRSYHSTLGLTDEDANHDPGHGAMSIAALVVHEVKLVLFMLETMAPGSTEDVPQFDIGEDGARKLAALLEWRECANERFREVFPTVTGETLMGKRPGMRPEGWAEWPVLMRVLRPLTDIATHVGQVCYARRQLGKPVG